MTAPAIATPSPGAPSATPTPPTPTPTPSPAPASTPTDPDLGPFAHLSPEEKDRVLALTVKQVREQGAELVRSRARIEELQSRPAAPVAAEDPKLFFEEPRKLVREELDKALAPFKEWMAGVSKMSDYDKLKQRVGSRNPVMKAILDHPELSAEVDRAMQAKGVEVNENTLTLAVASIKGALDLGLMPGVRLNVPSAPAPTPTPTPGVPVAVPPHIPPSAAPGPGAPSATPKLRELTENEMRLARESHMTPEQYVAWADSVTPATVVTVDRTTIDKEKKK